MTIASKALHQSKQNWGSGCYNIEHSLASQTLCSLKTKLLLSKLLLGVAIVGGDTRRKESLVKCLQLLQVIGKLCTKTYTITIHDIYRVMNIMNSNSICFGAQLLVSISPDSLSVSYHPPTIATPNNNLLNNNFVFKEQRVWLARLHRALAPSILHYFLAPPISNFQVMCCARDSNVSSFEDLSKALFVEHFTRLIEDLSFFFEIKQRLKCKTYSIDKEETSIIILKSFSYKVVSRLTC